MVVAGLSQQIELLNQRCVEHRQNTKAQEELFARSFAELRERQSGLEAQIFKKNAEAEEWARVVESYNIQMGAISALVHGNPGPANEIPAEKRCPALVKLAEIEQQARLVSRVLEGGSWSSEEEATAGPQAASAIALREELASLYASIAADKRARRSRRSR